MSSTSAPFDMSHLQSSVEGAAPPLDPTSVSASDGVLLAVRVYTPATQPRAALLFYHGGGAHSAAGYQLLAARLASDYSVKVYTPDLRGHGKSEGPRGDAPSQEQIHQDIDAVLEFAKKDNDYGIPVFLGGHSSGAGLMIQYATVYQQKPSIPIQGYLLVAPQLGPNSKVDRPGDGFAKVSVLPFIMNGIFGIMGHSPAVQFRYSDKEIKESSVVGFNTVNMANAITPMQPAEQLKTMAESHRIHLWMGRNDELFDVEKVKSLYPPTSVVEESTHLGILVEAYKFIGPWLLEAVSEQ